jgi:hypothetical protein
MLLFLARKQPQEQLKEPSLAQQQEQVRIQIERALAQQQQLRQQLKQALQEPMGQSPSGRDQQRPLQQQLP